MSGLQICAFAAEVIPWISLLRFLCLLLHIEPSDGSLLKLLIAWDWKQLRMAWHIHFAIQYYVETATIYFLILDFPKVK